MDTIKLIKDLLSNRTPSSIKDVSAAYNHAAVLLPLFIEDGGCKVLFTKRTAKVEHHKGQISFPGGVVDEKDNSFQDAALRESYEEIGLLTKDVEILGQIDDTLTAVSNFIIHPFVGLIPYPYQFRINSLEVESIIRVPLEIFFQKSNHKTIDSNVFGGSIYQGPSYQYSNDIIWGATARIMENLIRIIGQKLNLPEDGE